MNKSGIEAYEKSEEQIDFFIKRYPHLKTLVDNGTKDKSVFKCELCIRVTLSHKNHKKKVA